MLTSPEKDNLSYYLAFYRLAIVGNLAQGRQPFKYKNLVLLCNGEIYNHAKLRKEHDLPVIEGGSDCDVIMYLYEKKGIEYTTSVLDGEFAYILLDLDKKVVHFARDCIGVKPLYLAGTLDKETNKLIDLEISSELKGMIMAKTNYNIEHVYPRTIYTYDLINLHLSSQMYKNFSCSPLETKIEEKSVQKFDEEVYNVLVEALRKRVTNTEKPVCFLLSGGLDSSTLLSIALDLRSKGLLGDLLASKPFEVFTFGFHEDAPDVKSAKIMVDFLQTKYGKDCMNWTKVIMPLEEGIRALPFVIYYTETYDTTTIRASTPMYLISKYISEKTNIKVVISGEGSDELFGGYLYFKYAPNEYACKAEILKLLNNLYLFDALRADRTTAANGLEMRPPFLDKQLIDTVLRHPSLGAKDRNTKPLLRRVLEDKKLLPDEILHGKKEAFSDAVGLAWKDKITEHTTTFIDEYDHDHLEMSFFIPPVTSEMKYIQIYFHEMFGPLYHLVPHLWLPNQSWVKTGIEPSARVLSAYK